MPQIRCSCGEILKYGDIPCEIEYLFMSDTEFDKFSGMVDSEALFQRMKSFLQCPSCGRLWVFWNGYREAPQEFSPGGPA